MKFVLVTHYNEVAATVLCPFSCFSVSSEMFVWCSLRNIAAPCFVNTIVRNMTTTKVEAISKLLVLFTRVNSF